MGKFRTKIKGQSKGKRWPKGQSSNSNPTTRKFRDQARSCFFQPNLDDNNKSSLTSEALLKHDAIQQYSTTPMEFEQQQQQHEEEESFTTISGSTGDGTLTTSKTFASDWSDCTNISFKRFLNVFQPKSVVHKEMLAILAAITEVIKENNGTESSTEYYCALLTTLEQIYNNTNKETGDDNNNNEEQLTAVLSLINMGIRTVPDNVLKLNFNDVATKMLHILKDYINSNNNIVIKSILNILAVLLTKQELAVWNHDLTKQIFEIILNPFAVHTKPKWRKSAQESIVLIVQSDYFKSDDNIGNNIAADYVAEFCENTLNKCMGCNNTNTVVLSTIQTTGQTTILHVLGLMKETICYFSKNHMKKSCEILLRLMTLNYPIVTSCSLQVLYNLFSTQQAVVPSKLNAQLITALYEYQPSINDVQPMLAWMLVMQQAHVHLTDVDVGTACQLLPKIFTTITQLWLTDKHQIQTNVTHTLEILLKDSVQTVCLNQDNLKQYRIKIEKCFNTIIQGLNYQYYQVWHQVLYLISITFEISGEYCKEYFIDCLKQLAELRDSYKFSYNNELEHTIGVAVRTFGPDFVLNYINLTKTNNDDIVINLDRSWLLPILKENIKRSTLEYFYKNILPLAINCQKKSQKLAELNDGIGSHSYELFSIQLWSLLSSFCNQPIDIKENFKNLAKFLGITLQDKKELRLCIMASLRRLIKISQELNQQDDIDELSKYDKNYLPILFNLYTIKPIGSDEEGQRLACLDTIKMYLTIAKDELRQQLFVNALQRLDITTQDPEDYFIKESILDLIRVLIKYQNVENLTKLYEQQILPNIKQQTKDKGKKIGNNHNKKEQKKAYRLLEEICKNYQESNNCQLFIKKNHKQIEKLLNNSLNNCIISSKGARLKCYNYLIQSQQENLNKNSKLIKTIIPEIILSCKDINEKTRKTSFELLNLIGELLLKQNQIDDFIKMIIVGLIGNTQMITCTILGISSVLHNFSGSLGHENIRSLLETITELMKSPTREIVSSCLSFLNVYSKVLPSPFVASTLSTIIKSICNICDDSRRHFRIKIRNILDRLLRKFGYESIIQYVPVNDSVMYKRLRNLRKLNTRKKKLKEMKNKDENHSGSDNDDNDDDVNDVEDEFLIKSKPKNVDEILADLDTDDDLLDDNSNDDDDKEIHNKKNRKQKTWIEENEDMIVDFTDPTAVSRIRATKPALSNLKATTATTNTTNINKKSKDGGFKTANDGRLIIQDLSDNDNDTDNIKKEFNLNSSDSDTDDNDKNSIAETLLLSNRKRKRTTASVKSGMSSFSQTVPSKYKPGGVGIHRPTKALSVKSGHSSTTIRTIGSEYKSKKAKGDVKRKGTKFDPYAYLPLNRSLINKRKKMKAAGQFKHIVKAAKAGALKGVKAKKNLTKRKV